MAKPGLIQASLGAIRNNPKEIFNWYILFCTCIWSLSGVAKGFDEGPLPLRPGLGSGKLSTRESAPVLTMPQATSLPS